MFHEVHCAHVVSAIGIYAYIWNGKDTKMICYNTAV